MIPAGQEDAFVNISADLTFISRVQREVNAGGALPFNVPQTRIPEFVRRAALKFYKEYHGASEERWVFIPAEYIIDSCVSMTKHIISVHEVRALGDSAIGFGGVIKPSLLLQNVAAVGEFLNGKADYNGLSYNRGSCNVTVNENSENMAMASLWYASAMEQTFSSRHYIHSTWNANTSRLIIDNHKGNMVARVLYGIELEYLYEDDLFIKYVTGLCLSELDYILGAFDFKLPGGVTINYAKYQEKGDKWMEEVLTEFEESDENDIMIIT